VLSSVTWRHAPPAPGRAPTIWEALAVKLGREPTNAEAAEEVKRILREASEEQLVARAMAGRLPHQRRRR
jgi:hypothetical protein